MNGFCRFGTSCRYSHKLPKEVEEQNKKIESIEKVNALLSKQVKDQNDEIRGLKSRLIEIETRELKSLQKQINDLAKNNCEKETAIKNIMKISKSKESGEEINNEKNQRQENGNVTLEEVVVTEERCEAETIKEATIKYAHKCLTQVEKLEEELRKIKKNADDLGTTLKAKCNFFFERLDDIEVSEELCEEVIEKIVNLREYLSFTEKKPDKERNLKTILNCKKYLKGYIKYPKRPSQMPKIQCCKKCLRSLYTC